MKKCKQCGHCCCHLPGFFEPERNVVQEVATYLQRTIEEVQEAYLIQDYRAPFGEKIWFWTPVMVDRTGKTLQLGTDCTLADYPVQAERLGQQGGHCVFYQKETAHCLIHPVKPLSCQLYNCQEQEENTIGRLYFLYFGGAGVVRRINQAEWAEIWDFCCPKCGADEAGYTGEVETDKVDYHKVFCDHCGYDFWVY